MEALSAGRPRERPHALTVGGRAGEAMPSKAAGDQVSSSQAPDTGYRAAGLVFTLPGVSLAPWYVPIPPFLNVIISCVVIIY